MKVSFPMCEQILDTLPVGYYVGRRIPIDLNEEKGSSYYNPMEDKIYISYPLIAKGLKEADYDGDIEAGVRAMLYHEISHAILTPPQKHDDITNVFEDERIETLLSDFYMNVDFKDNLYRITGGPYKATSPKRAFFNAVRFRLAPQHIKDKIVSIIEEYKSMNRQADYYEFNQYMQDIHNLYEEIKKEYKNDPEQFNPQNGSDGSENGSMSDNNNNSDENSDSDNGEGEGEGKEENAENNNNKDGGEGEEQEKDAAFKQKTQTKEELARAKGKNTLIGSALEKVMDQIFNNPFSLSPENREKLDKFRFTIEMILNNFKKKNTGGSGICAYSGVFNPRSVRRDDYRYFDRAITTQGNNKFGTCHLNLFIDCSGSFWPNEKLVNGILSVLSEIERKNRIFTMSVAFCGEGVHVVENKQERVIECTGGNWLPENMKQIFLSLQKQNTCNYNIVLFDGDAFSDSRALISKKNEIFHSFDFKQTTLITDPDNSRYMSPKFSSSDVIVTKNYTEELLDNITRALTIAFG